MKKRPHAGSLVALILLSSISALYPNNSDHDFALSWMKKGLVACSTLGGGYYLYSKHIRQNSTPLAYQHHLLQKGKQGPITIFVHGYDDTYQQAYDYIKTDNSDLSQYKNRYSLISSPSLVTFNFADAGTHTFRINRKETSMAQEREIQRLKEIVDRVEDEFPQQDIILYGLSRGASTIITYLATHPNPNVKAIVLESPFGNLADIINNFIHMLGWELIPGIKRIGMIFGRCLFPYYKEDGIHPIEVVDKLPQDLPILIISSQQDRLVPASSSIGLYDKLTETGHSNAQLLLLDHGKHAKIIADQDAQLYEDVVNAFYKQFGL